MKLTTLLIVLTMLQVSAKSFAQQVTLSERNSSLESIFNSISTQTGYDFLFIRKTIKKAKPVSIDVKNAELRDVLQEIFDGQPLKYSVEDRSIVVTSSEASVATSKADALQQMDASGKVTDEGGNVLQGATIRVKGKTTGAVSDENGTFIVRNLLKGDVLVVSYAGFATQEIQVNGTQPITVVLKTDQKALDEIVVVGYGTQKKSDVTGAISTVDIPSVLGNRPISTLSSVLQNVVPGLNISIPSGQPGSSTSFNIRGATTLNTSGNSIVSGAPLILVDNVPFNGPLNMIDPNNIATITTLKDAGSAAIYGGRSAFGVILITTKKGLKNQKPQFSISSQVSFARAGNLPDLASPEQFLQSLSDMGTTTFWSGQNVALWRQLYDSIQANPDQMPASGVIYRGQGYPVRRTNPIKDLMGGTVPHVQNNFAVTGGGKKTTYRFAFGNTHEKGIMVPDADLDHFKRYNVASSFKIDLTKWLTAEVEQGYYNEITSKPSDQGFVYYVAATYPSLLPITDSLTANSGVKGINGSPKNIATLSGAQAYKTSDLRLTGRAIVKPFDGLTITGDYTYDNLQSNETYYNRLISVVNAMNFNVSNFGKGIYRLSNQSTLYKSLNIFANYDGRWGDHHANFMVGYNQEENITSGDLISRTNMTNPSQPSIANATGPIIAGDNYASYALRGYFSRINYDYKGKYLLQLNGRYDGTSNFPAGRRFGFFPSGALGWRISDEAFMRSFSPVLSNLKMRVSYGSVGNQNIDSYAYIPIMSGVTPGWLTGTTAYLTSFTTPGLISSNFSWEKVQTADVGIDFGLLSDRLTGSFDLYQRDTKNILALGAIPLPALLGASAPLQNSASLRSKGYDIELTYRNRADKKVQFSISASLSNNKAYVTKFSGNPNKLLNTYYEGQQVGEIWGYTTDGFYSVGDFEEGTLKADLTGGTLLPNIPKFQGENPNPGDIRFKDFDGDGVVFNGVNTKGNSGDLRIIGNSAPRYLYGLRGSVSYKHVTFSFALSGVGKQDLALANTLVLPTYNAYSTIYAYQTDYWTPSNTDAYFGRLYDKGSGNQKFNQRMPQTKFLQNGAYLRVNNLTLDYAVPTAWLRKIALNTLHVFCSLENPFLFDHLPKGLEPGLTSQGEGMQYPFLSKTSFGVNLTF